MSKISNTLSKLRIKLNHNPVVGYSIVAVGIAIFGVLTYVIVELNTREPREAPDIKIAPRPAEKYYSPLSGVQVKTEADTKKPITAVMIENSPASRPHSGLAQAEVVYEAVAEGGITRFMVLYQQNKPGLIGPVRSLRTYFVDWLTPYKPSVAHVGGSAQALRIVRNGSYRDIDQFFNAEAYWRASDRYAPHNVYTNSKRLDALNKRKGFTSSTLEAIARQDAPKDKKSNATAINIDFSSATYNTRYSYDKKSNKYVRSYAIGPHKDREKGNIAPSVVIAMKTTMTAVNEDGYRESIKTTGSGEAIIFQNGDVTKATWKKPNRNAPLTFIDKAGKQVPLNRGLTWIAAVPINQSGAISWK